MLQLISTVSALTVMLILLLAAAEHALRPTTLTAALRAHDVIPGRLLRPASFLVIAVEAALGCLGAYGMALGAQGQTPLRVSLAASVVLFLGYGGYTIYLLRLRPGVPCGCSGQDIDVNGWIVGRAVVLAGLAALALAGGRHTVFVEPAAARVTVSLLAAITLSTLLWHLPIAMQDPLRRALDERRRALLATAEEHT